jgi:uncharacterized lipoprotein YmbA
MKALRLKLAASMMGAAVGCASAPIHYYTLVAPSADTAAATPLWLAVEVRVVHVPPQLNHSGLMVRNGPAELTLLENERWASPVKDEITNALRLELQQRLAVAQAVAGYGKLVVQLDVRRLEAELANRTWLEASFIVTMTAHAPSADTRQVTCSFRAEQTIQGGYAQIVAGYQRDIAALADAIAAAVAGAANGAAATCQSSSSTQGR